MASGKSWPFLDVFFNVFDVLLLYEYFLQSGKSMYTLFSDDIDIFVDVVFGCRMGITIVFRYRYRVVRVSALFFNLDIGRNGSDFVSRCGSIFDDMP